VQKRYGGRSRLVDRAGRWFTFAGLPGLLVRARRSRSPGQAGMCVARGVDASSVPGVPKTDRTDSAPASKV